MVGTEPFDQDSPDAEADCPATPRDGPRESIFLSGNIVFKDSSAPLTVRIRNISPGGMMIDFRGQANVGEAVISDVKGINAVSGKVAWVAGGRMGISFDHKVDPQLARVRLGEDNSGIREGYRNPFPADRRPGLAIR